MSDAVHKMKGEALSAGATVKENICDTGSAAGDRLSAAYEKGSGYAAAAAERSKEAGGSIVDTVKDYGSTAGAKIRDAAGTATETAKRAGAATYATGADVSSAVGEGVKETGQAARDVAAAAKDKAVAPFS